MKVQLKRNICIVKADKNEKIYNESLLLHRVKKELIKQGYDVIKKLAYKDGHMIADTQHIIRDRKNKFVIYDANYAIRFSYEEFNKGELVLLVQR